MPDEQCTFCAILTGERPGHVVLSDDVCTAFLDTRPVFKGHVLVVPPTHVETLPDLPVPQVGPFFERVRTVAAAVEHGLEAGGTFVAMNNRISQSVPHLHVHVVPRNRKDGLRGFFWPRTTYADQAEAESYALRIRKALAAAS
ncbi:histidine triad (HIT) family protein [Streptosporangium becharense]|uniref:Histidine triad (HIT) family protein n=1 Tax=Streptosporangium becharense TaxID=1816182 RepID=A0A7W9IL07_9ACTN|nr:HIT family protein [Streptosporangium becharense]MBB2911492.1 histidine triad (HIT) family protein [Streptosporangium becharense]MBB5822690.1 histidine triad (HIT) family protein [Streptosporangium becharense]